MLNFIHSTHTNEHLHSPLTELTFRKFHMCPFCWANMGHLTLLRARDLGMKKREACPLRGSHLPARPSGALAFPPHLGSVHWLTGGWRVLHWPPAPCQVSKPGGACCPFQLPSLGGGQWLLTASSCPGGGGGQTLPLNYYAVRLKLTQNHIKCQL